MKKVIVLIGALVLSTILPISSATADQCAVMGPNGCVLTEAQAQASNNGGAGQCNPSNPCGTYAVVNSNNSVTNVIVCQPTVCGSGTFNNEKVVLQVPANPVTGQTQGSVFNNSDGSSRNVTYNDSTKTFTADNGNLTFAAPVVKTESNSSETLMTTLASPLSTLQKSADTITVATLTTATLSVTTDLSQFESQTFYKPKTVAQLETELQSFPLISSRLTRFIRFLEGWLI